jgi:DNA polymerase I-like protein with 3'-5' exonuclease and polymerase domains
MEVNFSELESKVAACVKELQDKQDTPRRITGYVTITEDIHKRTAAELFNVPVDIVSKPMRDIAKAINFIEVFGGNRNCLMNLM